MHVVEAGPAAVYAGMAEAVVGGALLRVAEHRVGFVDFLETARRLFAAVVAVGMVLHGELAKGRVQIWLAATAVDAKHLVIIALRQSVRPLHNRRTEQSRPMAPL